MADEDSKQKWEEVAEQFDAVIDGALECGHHDVSIIKARMKVLFRVLCDTAVSLQEPDSRHRSEDYAVDLLRSGNNEIKRVLEI